MARSLISLDTSFLINALLPGSTEGARTLGWLESGETLNASAIAWYEFVSGPVREEHIDLARSLLLGGILPFSDVAALESARLFNATGRLRRLRVDAMIAGATAHGSSLATNNREDFKAFVPHGLLLV